ncbi:magnesium transporter [Grimontia sp. AD028]|uniref:CorA family divalent cation transporter n=1 Tax=Grimontia sp. AD028 TaxID=1581149 RepID=UPI00061B4396|nr:CorA family divalent cation transporter [Grimontia sp. AD028]KKD58747.1 magnesium transporter [Grimontia sp. AD028]
MSGFIISSWNFSEGKAKPNALNASPIAADNWYHCQRDAIGLRDWLEENAIPEAIIDSLLTDDTRPRFEQFHDECFLMILRGINLNEGSAPDDMLSLRILWFKGAIISTRKVPTAAVSILIERLEKGIGPHTLPKLLVGIANGINGIISDFLSPVEDRIDDLEDEDAADLKTLNALNSRLLRLRRYLKPQRYVFEDLLHADMPVLKGQKNHFKNCLDTIARMNESIEFYIDQINLYQANVNQQQAEVMNRNTYLFSVIAGIFLPAGFFTGLLGVNIGGIPGVENPMAFPLFCVALLVVVALEVVILKRLRFI